MEMLISEGHIRAIEQNIRQFRGYPVAKAHPTAPGSMRVPSDAFPLRYHVSVLGAPSDDRHEMQPVPSSDDEDDGDRDEPLRMWYWGSGRRMTDAEVRDRVVSNMQQVD